MTLEEIERELIVAKSHIDEALNGIYGGITGEIKIHEPAPPKKVRKTRKKKERDFPAPVESPAKDLRDDDRADDSHPFYGRKRSERKASIVG